MDSRMQNIFILNSDLVVLKQTLSTIFKTVLSSGYILMLHCIEYILASLIEMCQG